MDRHTQLRALVRIADLGSLTAAAAALDVGQSAVSKGLAALERDVGVPLVHRTTRALHLTDAGALLVERARVLLEGWDDALDEVRAREPRIAGPVRLSLPVVFGARHVVPHLGTLLDRHPLLSLELSFTDRYVDLVDEGFHAAIRVGAPVPSTLRSRILGSAVRRLVCAPGRELAHPSELRDLPCLVHSGVPRTVWSWSRGEERVSVEVSGRVRADNSDALRQLAIQGQGIALLASWLVDDDLAAVRLVALLPDWEAPPAPIAALLPPSRRVPARVRVVLDHLREAWAG
ncbi:MAG: LysR family transcriptional regulator [Alphaproteobacteria bacterium]|nr:LysR family transcriptional regulator [Alphaproteobacteria bacterium]MCB9699522.1 LysR family transcriptional regulator [Alphaproteobacteria bacterium]